MATDPGLAVQTALYAKLSAALAPVPVYDFVPAETAFPYVTIGADIATPDDAKDSSAQNVLVQIDVWSRERGRAESKAVAGSIYAALHMQPLVVPGFSIAWVRFDFATSMLDPDGITFHSITRYRIRAEAA